jgi:hypothetical protein
MDQPLTRAEVVDLLRYRQEKARLEGLRPRLAAMTPFRPLTPRQLDHRERMLRHLWEVKSQKSKVKSTDRTTLLRAASVLLTSDF